MDLSNLKPNPGSNRRRKRIARGVGSGYGGHSSTRGDKGQKSRSGAKIPAWFEGGQMPLQRRIPKFGFKNRFRKQYKAVNVDAIGKLVETGRVESGDVSPDSLRAAGVIGKSDLVKILGSGDITVAVTVTAHAFSASAREKIEEAGGSTAVVE